MSRLHSKLKDYIEDYDVERVSSNGVYGIFHTHHPTKLYIGSTERSYQKKKCRNGCYGRWIEHYSRLKFGEHHSPYLQTVVNKHGIEGIRFKVVQNCEEDVRDVEQFFIDKYRTYNGGYNTSKSSVHNTMPEEKRKAHSKRMKNNNPMKDPEATKRAMKTRFEKHPPKKIKQFTKGGEFVREWDSALEAALQVGVDPSNINRAATGKAKSSAGYIWEYS